MVSEYNNHPIIHLDIDSNRYGTYQQEPEEPYVGSPTYQPHIYNTWDPNWRGFIGTTLIIIMEEYEHLLSHDTQELVLESLHNATKGDEYRVGGVDNDNLYPAYSNPVRTSYRSLPSHQLLISAHSRSCVLSFQAGLAVG